MNSPADSPRSWSFRTPGARAISSVYTTTKFHCRVPGGSRDTQHHRGIQQCSDSHGYGVMRPLVAAGGPVRGLGTP